MTFLFKSSLLPRSRIQYGLSTSCLVYLLQLNSETGEIIRFSVVHLEIGKYESSNFVFFKVILAILGHCTSIKDQFVKFCKKIKKERKTRISTGTALNYGIMGQFGENCYLIILSLLIHEQVMSFYSFYLSLFLSFHHVL